MAGSVFYQRFGMGDKERGDDLVTANALSFGLQVSKKWSMLDPYAGIAYDRFALDAFYRADNLDSVELAFRRNDTIHLTFGLSLNLGFLNVHCEYNLRCVLSAQTEWRHG